MTTCPSCMFHSVEVMAGYRRILRCSFYGDRAAAASAPPAVSVSLTALSVKQLGHWTLWDTRAVTLKSHSVQETFSPPPVVLWAHASSSLRIFPPETSLGFCAKCEGAAGGHRGPGRTQGSPGRLDIKSMDLEIRRWTWLWLRGPSQFRLSFSVFLGAFALVEENYYKWFTVMKM